MTGQAQNRIIWKGKEYPVTDSQVRELIRQGHIEPCREPNVHFLGTDGWIYHPTDSSINNDGEPHWRACARYLDITP